MHETRPYLAGAALIICAMFLHGAMLDVMMFAIMLFAPMMDSGWRTPRFSRSRDGYKAWCGVLLVMVGLLLFNKSRVVAADAVNIVVAAIPEEWFFRAYLLERMGRTCRSNMTSTALFALVHGLTRGPVTALLVITPSLAYGWLYQKTRDLVLLVLIHALSNLVYAIYLRSYF